MGTRNQNIPLKKRFNTETPSAEAALCPKRIDQLYDYRSPCIEDDHIRLKISSQMVCDSGLMNILFKKSHIAQIIIAYFGQQCIVHIVLNFAQTVRVFVSTALFPRRLSLTVHSIIEPATVLALQSAAIAKMHSLFRNDPAILRSNRHDWSDSY